MKYVIRDREAGNRIEEVATLEEARVLIQKFEEEDKAENIFVENFYEIYDEENDEIIY